MACFLHNIAAASADPLSETSPPKCQSDEDLNLTDNFIQYEHLGNHDSRDGRQHACPEHDVKVVPTRGMLTDHFNPQTKTVALSEAVYSSRSVAAAAVAAHECGHAVQHATGYAFVQMRTALVPVVSFASSIVQWVLLAGVLMIQTMPGLLWVGIGLFALTTLFSFVTLPVEINASARAITWLSRAGITDSQTRPMAIDALKWAAYTYVIAAIGSLATLLYYIGIARSRD